MCEWAWLFHFVAPGQLHDNDKVDFLVILPGCIHHFYVGGAEVVYGVLSFSFCLKGCDCATFVVCTFDVFLNICFMLSCEIIHEMNWHHS